MHRLCFPPLSSSHGSLPAPLVRLTSFRGPALPETPSTEHICRSFAATNVSVRHLHRLHRAINDTRTYKTFMTSVSGRFSFEHTRASSQSTGLNRAGPMGRWRGIARPAEKSVRTPSQPAFRPSMGKLLPHTEPEAGALVPNFSARLAPSAGAVRNGRNGGNGSHAKSTNRTDLWTALLHSQTQAQAQRRRQRRFDLKH